MRVRVGCTGWGYDDWRGGFYPSGTPASEYLRRYARVFPIAEVDSTYYRAPTPETAARWAREVPEGFLFFPKLPSSITHEARFKNTETEVAAFLASVEPLRRADKLGPIVVQTGPGLQRERDSDALFAFLDSIPKTYRVALELRNASWWTPPTYRHLANRNTTLVWSVTEYGTTPPVLTSDTVYVRMIGDRALEKFDRLQRDLRSEMVAMKERLEREGASAREVFVLLNNHFMGFAPETAAIMQDVLGLPRADLAAASRDPRQRKLTFDT